MFYGITTIKQIDLSVFDASKVTKMNSMFRECSNLERINFGNINTSSVEDMSDLFHDCSHLIEIDLTNFDTSSVTKMNYMFSGCVVIQSIDATSFNTSNVEEMGDMFSHNVNLVSINVSSFDTSKVRNMRGIFYRCDHLKYLNLQNFDASMVTSLSHIFGYCLALVYLNLKNFKILNEANVNLDRQAFEGISENVKYCIEDANTKYFLIQNNYSNCSDLCFQDNIKFDMEENRCTEFCDENKYEYKKECHSQCPENTKIIFQDERNICVDIAPDNFYFDNNDNKYKECYKTCKKCHISGNWTYNNCDECIYNYTFLNESFIAPQNCFQKCEFNYYFNESEQYSCTQTETCLSKYNKLIPYKNKCIDDCQIDDTYKYDYKNTCLKECPSNIKIFEEKKKCLDECYQSQFEYNNICYNDCPNGTFRLFQNRNICVDIVPENYYLDNNDDIYKECYNSCKKCSEFGNETNNNCDECIDNFNFLNDSFVPRKNCFKNCEFYYYFNESFQYICTQSNICPLEYTKLIVQRNKCVNDCKNDDIYNYDYNNICLNECPSNIKTYEEEKKCLDECYPNQFEYNNICYNNCPDGIFRLFQNRNICVDVVPENYYLDNDDNIYKKCYNNCKKCSHLGNETNNNCDECINNYKFISEPFVPQKNCFKNCEFYYYFNKSDQYICTRTNSCPLEYNKLISLRYKCIDDCQKDDTYKYDYHNDCLEECPLNAKIFEAEKICLDECYQDQFEYNNICYNDCPLGTFRLFQIRNICVNYVPENYYLDHNDNIYKECYNTCKKCSQPGNEAYHNCEECINNYKFFSDLNASPQNCYKLCDLYYYFDENNQYHCTPSCPSPYNKLINPKQKCIDDCKKDDEYIFEYNINCVKICPENTKTYYEEKKCLETCMPKQIEYNKICYNEFPNDTYNLFQNGNIFVNNGTNFTEILNDVILAAYTPGEGQSLVIQRPDDIVYHVTNSKNELELLKNLSNTINNLSIIDLGECETVLRNAYHINENDSLIFIKNEYKSSKASEKKVDFEVYEPYNKTKLNLSICDETSINLYIPMELSDKNKNIYEQMKESGYDMFNLSDPFYQDVCTPFDSGNGTDILLSDRIDYIYNNDDTLCQSNCQFSQYSMESKYMNCSCSTNENANNDNNKNDKFSAKKIYESFYDVLKYSNYDIIKCFDIISDIKVITINIGSILVISYFSLYLVCFFIFIFRGIIPLKIKLRVDLNKANKNNLEFKLNIQNLLYPPIKKKTIRKLILRADLEKKNEMFYKKKLNKLSLDRQKKFDDNIKIYPISNSNSALDNSPNEKFEDLKVKKENSIDKKETENNISKEYSDYELNELEYEEAVELDKRSLIETYWVFLKREHLIIFTFFSCKDYNLLSIKLTRFIFLIVGDMALNVFFFSDDSMHKLFLNYGKYDFFQQIPQITYSTIISQLIEVFLCFLSLTDKYIYQIKSCLERGNTDQIKKITRCIYIKLLFFYLFTFIMFGIYWYIISVFCGVYRNTQKTFIKDSIVSFSICLIYPLALYLLSASLRICALRDSKKRFKCIYKLSDIIPLF